MKISVIGAGNVGATLARRWSGGGHDVVVGARSPEATQTKTGLANVLPVAEALLAAEIIVLSTPYEAALELMRGASALDGKIIVDATNPLAPGLTGLSVSGESSGAEELQKLQSRAHVVKCFNTTGFNNMSDPRYPSGSAVMFLCGGDAIAKTKVKLLSDELGFETLDAGPLSMARALEAHALLWIKLAYAQGHGREFAFVLSKR